MSDPVTTQVSQAAALPATASVPPANGWQMFIANFPLILMIGVMFFFIFYTSWKEKKRRKELLESLKKDAKVLTTGGIVGVIAEVKEDEVVLIVDEHANTRITFSKAAVTGLLK